tara:strand:+ start:216 stop:893 length:678 start_codon:yes stop_codon:yes gene_type:complete
MVRSKILALLTAISLGAAPTAFANEDKITKGFYTMDAMGCMLLRECTEDVQELTSIQDIKNYYPDSDFSAIDSEFNSIIRALNKVGVKVFLGAERYFPAGHRGVYHTVSNNFFLNERFMHRQGVLMSVMRHEGWHAAQDCMAGSIENSLIAIIKPEEEVPPIWRELAERTYPPSAVPWEAEASWAGRTEDMTAKALEACATGAMWEVYEPTPLTEQWLIENEYIK